MRLRAAPASSAVPAADGRAPARERRGPAARRSSARRSCLRHHASHRLAGRPARRSRAGLENHAHTRHRTATVLSRARHADRDSLARSRPCRRPGTSVDVLTYHVGEDPKLPGVRVFRAPAVPFVHDVPIGFSVRKMLCDVALLWRLFTLTRRNRYDVLHAVEEAVFLSLLVRGVGVPRRLRHGLVVARATARQVWRVCSALDGLLRRLERLAIARSDLVMAVCEDLAVRARGVCDGDTRRRRRGRLAARRRPRNGRRRGPAPRLAGRRTCSLCTSAISSTTRAST